MARSPRRTALRVDPIYSGPIDPGGVPVPPNARRVPQTGGGLINNTGIKRPSPPMTGGGLINNTGIRQQPNTMPIKPPQMMPQEQMSMGPQMDPGFAMPQPMQRPQYGPGVDMMQRMNRQHMEMQMPQYMNRSPQMQKAWPQQMSPMYAQMKLNNNNGQ